MDEPIRNEADVLKENKELTEKLAKAVSDIVAFTALMDEATKRCDASNAKLLEMEASLAAAQATIAEKDKCIVGLQETLVDAQAKVQEFAKKDYDFNQAVSAEVAKLGIRKEAVPVPVEPTKKELKGLARAIAAHRETK